MSTSDLLIYAMLVLSSSAVCARLRRVRLGPLELTFGASDKGERRDPPAEPPGSKQLPPQS
jgi:hypothetical protein